VKRINPKGRPEHERAVAVLRASYAAVPDGSPVRLAKKTSNLFRPRSAAGPAGLDVSGLDGVIEIDPLGRTADV
jgi:FAD/FMN-containing dehydrogenase